MVLQSSEAEKLSHSIKANTDVPQKQYRRKSFRILFSVIVIFSSENRLGLLFHGFHTLASNSARCLAYLTASLSKLSRIFKVFLVFKLSHLKRLEVKVIFSHWKNHET